MKAIHTQTPQIIAVDNNPTYPKAINQLKANKELPGKVELRQQKYLNNIVKQDHKGITEMHTIV